MSAELTLIAPPSRIRRSLTSKVAHQNIIKAMVLVAALSMVTKLASAAQQVAAAASFGTHNSIEAYFMAALIPMFSINVVAGSLTTTLVPAYIATRTHEGQVAADRLLGGGLTLALVALVVTSLLLACLGHQILGMVGAGFSPAKLALAEHLYYLLLPAITFAGMASVWTAALNANERFGWASLAPIAVPAMSMLSIWLLQRHIGVNCLAWGSDAGYMVQAGLLMWALHRRGMSCVPRWYGMSPAIRRMLAQYLPQVGASLLVCSSPLVDQRMATFLGARSVAAIVYSEKIMLFITGIGAMALGTAVLPYFSAMAERADWRMLSRSVTQYSGLILLVTVPLTVLIYFNAGLLASLVYQRGAFTAQDSSLVAGVLSLLVLQLPFFTVGILLVRLISALRANNLLFWISVSNALCNIGLDWILMRWLGVRGIALATTFVYLVSCAWLIWAVQRRIRVTMLVPAATLSRQRQ